MNFEIEAALEIALAVHSGQMDKTGRSYILHVLRVAAKAQNDIELITALLHDAVEDSYGKLFVEDLVEIFPWGVVEAIRFLTRYPGEKYMDYIKNLSKNPLATRIKLYDLADNLDVKTRHFIGAESLFKRYEKAEEYLLRKVNSDKERYGY